MPETQMLTESAAARARELAFFAKIRVEGLLKSENKSKLKGQSTDFLQHRPYAPGDDPRTIDWRVFARSDRLVTREYEEHTNFDVYFCLDASGSMEYGSENSPTKIEFARRCIVMFAYVLLLQKDRFSLAVLDSRVRNFTRPVSGRRRFAEFVRNLAEVEPDGETNIAAGIELLAARVKRRSVFVIFSDCYQDPATLCKALGGLRARGHDVVLHQIHDTAEADLPFSGFTLFRDLETGEIDPADPIEIAAAYREVFAAHEQQLHIGTAKHGIEFHNTITSHNWEDTLATLLRLRTAMR